VYESNESGLSEIYVKSVSGEGKQQVSRGGGRAPRWKRDGKELFYVNPSNQIMRVAVAWSGAPQTGPPVVLFTPCKRGDPNPLYEGRWYDTTPDGRFLMPCGTTRDTPILTVTVGWANQFEDSAR
jgi:hypothetical protein